MVKLDLCDEIDLEWKGGDLVVECDVPGLDLGSTNILWKTADLVRRESGHAFGLTMKLKKKIPIAAGLGGGSSDAAILLKALNQTLELGWGPDRLVDIGCQIGADLPFFLAEGAQRVTGIGEKLEPIQIPPLPMILINP
jgi:4-diphosphocytidyl-2-C-methyl-D-erythritol kinase